MCKLIFAVAMCQLIMTSLFSSSALGLFSVDVVGSFVAMI